MLNGSHEPQLRRAGPAASDSAEEPAARAEQLFADLLKQGQDVGPRPASSSAGDTHLGEASASSEPRPLTEREIRTFLLGARDAVDRVGDVAKAARSETKATTKDLAALGAATEHALDAINARLETLERILLGLSAPRPEAAEEVMASLRSSVRRAGQRAGMPTPPPTKRVRPAP